MKRLILLLAVILSGFPLTFDAQANTSVTFTRTGDGTYDINPGDGYYFEEHYTIYAVQRYPQADSIVFEFSEYEWNVSGTFSNQRLTFTIHNHNSSIDYYVLYIERYGMESQDKL